MAYNFFFKYSEPVMGGHVCNLHLYAKQGHEYGELHQEHLLEQYKMLIQGIDYTSKWKHTTNSYFLTIHTMLLTAVGLSAARGDIAPELTHDVIPIIGVLLALVWWASARRYNDVLAAKFFILHCVEQSLPLALYKTEWELLRASHGSPNRVLFLELAVPMLFLIFYQLIFFMGR